MMDLSSDTEIKSFPLGWNNTVRTQLSCPTCRDYNRPTRALRVRSAFSSSAAAQRPVREKSESESEKKSEGAVRGS